MCFTAYYSTTAKKQLKSISLEPRNNSHGIHTVYSYIQCTHTYIQCTHTYSVLVIGFALLNSKHANLDKYRELKQLMNPMAYVTKLSVGNISAKEPMGKG